MTLSTTTSKQSYAGDSSTTVFPVPFLFLDNSHITAVLRDANGVEAVWVENTQYTLTGDGDPAGGTLTVETLPTDYTPVSGETLVIRRVVPETQGTDYPEGGAFPAAAHEQALDRLTMLVQQHSEELARSLHYPVSDSASIGSESPNSADRASKFAAWDASGAPIASAGPTGDNSIPVSSFMETLLDDATAAAARTTLDAEQADADILKADTADVLTAGFAGTVYDAGTKSTGTFTPDEANGNLQKAVNGGAHTLAPPTNDTTIIVQFTNDASAGTITTSGFTIVDGDTLTTTDGHDFFLTIIKMGSFSSLTVKALQ